jgi:hypothetical protein
MLMLLKKNKSMLLDVDSANHLIDALEGNNEEMKNLWITALKDLKKIALNKDD